MILLEENGSLYDYLASKNIEGFRREVKIISVDKGTVLYDTSEPYTHIYEIKCGAFKLGTLSLKGEKYIYEVVKSGDIFGNTAFLPETFSEFSKAIVPSTLYVYKLDFFKQHILHDRVAVEEFIKHMVSRWHKIEKLFSYIRYIEPKERVKTVYNYLALKVLTTDNRTVAINKNLTNKDIADLTATTRQLVAATLKML